MLYELHELHKTVSAPLLAWVHASHRLFSDPYSPLAYTPISRHIAAGSELITTSGDGKLRLWDIASGRLVGSPLPGADTGGWGDSFPDGKHAISVFNDGTGVIWNLDPAAWSDEACRIGHRNLTRAEWHDLLPHRAYRAVCP